MSLLVIGLNHKTASVEIRESFAVSDSDNPRLVEFLTQDPSIDSCVLLSTCNRSEFYLDSNDANVALNRLCEWFQSSQQQLTQHIYQHHDKQAAKHLFEVVAGIDSLILGEVQISGQVKSAFETAKSAHKISQNLNRLFQNAFRVAKLVRNETDIGKNPVSVAHTAVQLSQQIFGKLQTQSILTVGAGETSELLLRYLGKHPCQKLSVCNRSDEKGKALATQMEAGYFNLSQLSNRLFEYDLLFTATSSPEPLISLEMVESALKLRKHKPMVIIDLAIPRDTDARVKKLNDVFYYTVDDLQKVISENLKSRQQSAINAGLIISAEVDSFMNWLKAQKHKNLIHNFQRETAKIRKQSLDKALKQLQNGNDPEEVLFFLANNLTKKLNHTPVKALSEVIQSGDVQKIDFFKKIMKLDD